MSWKLVSEFMLTDVQIAILTCKLNRPGIAGGTNFCEGRAMTSTTTNKFLRAACSCGSDDPGHTIQHPSRCAAVTSIPAKTGSTPQTMHD